MDEQIDIFGSMAIHPAAVMLESLSTSGGMCIVFKAFFHDSTSLSHKTKYQNCLDKNDLDLFHH